MDGKRRFSRVAFAVVGIAALVVAVFIMSRGLGLVEGLDFGAGSYYYADIPEFDKFTSPANEAFKPSLPYWVYVVLFLLWGVLMYLLWKRIDRK